MRDTDVIQVGYGTWKLPRSEETVKAISNALNLGYKHLDTAAAYANESYICEGIKQSKISREEMFISGKLWNSKRKYEKAIRACKTTIKNLEVDYLDMYLIHWPETINDSEMWEEKNLETWNALEYLYNEGLVKNIGVCNCKCEQLESLIKHSKIKPSLNQIEFHPGCNQSNIIKYCKENNVKVEGWSPLGNGGLLNNSDIEQISNKYNKTVAQICLRWCIQHNVTPITKSMNIERMKQNLTVFDFILNEQDMVLLDLIQESRVDFII